MNHLPNDTTLPALALLFDWPVITQGFRTCLGLTPGDARPDQPWQVIQCQHLRYQPGVRCTATYTLRQASPSEAPRQSIGVVDCTPDGLSYRPFTQDETLPWLTTAVDPTIMTDRLASLAVKTNAAPAQSASWRVTPVRYRPGERCAIQYSRSQATETTGYFGKLLRSPHPQRMRALPALHALTEQEPTLPRLPRPLAHWPDLHLLLQPVVNGAEFHAVVFDETLPVLERVQWFNRMGAKVAALHNLPSQDLPPRPLTEEWPELIAAQPLIERLAPALATAYSTTLAALMTIAPTLPLTAPVVSHGALRTDQFLLQHADGGANAEPALLLIDLDTLCLADPACDLGNCLAYLHWKALRQPHYAPFIRQAHIALLAGYQRQRTLPETTALAFYQALAFLKIAGRRFSNLSYREWFLTPALVEAAAALLSVQPTSRMGMPL